MNDLFEVKEVDTLFYNRKLKEFLPNEIFDVHTHVWLDRLVCHSDDELSKVVSWPSKVAKENSIEDLKRSYELLFPDQKVTPLIFSDIHDKNNLNALNNYCAACAAENGFPALAVVRPDWEGDKFESVVKNGNFRGAKVYLTFSPAAIPVNEIEIYDFLPPHQLEILDRNGWMVILHIARPQRLKDPVNIAQLLEIEKRYPNVKLVVAHVGRAYCLEDVGNAFDLLRGTQNMLFDISANTNAEVFRMLIRAVGPQRILFGSDLPVTRMRMKRICEKGRYINLVPGGLYGDISKDPHMREIEKAESEKLSFFIYEQIEAFKQAAMDCHLSDKDIEDIFNNNARRVLDVHGE